MTASCAADTRRAHTTGPGGGIGRRAGFRCQCPYGRGGSSPLLGTKMRNKVNDFKGLWVKSLHERYTRQSTVVVHLVVNMEYLTQDPKSGRYRYRRRVPRGLSKLIGKREFSVSLKTTDQRLALERYDRVHREVEADIAATRAVDPADVEYRATLRTLRKHNLVTPTLKLILPRLSGHPC